MSKPKGSDWQEDYLLLQTDDEDHLKYLFIFLDLQNSGDQIVFQNIMKYAERLLCKSILIEKSYIDMDYRNEFSNLYSKTFAKFDSRCLRLHFFGKRIKNIDYLLRNQISSESVDYLGFSVLRPIIVGKVGRTVLRPHKESDDTFYPLCTARFSVHLFGKEIFVDGSPFISQDTMVMVCAQSAIWIAALYMHQKFNFPRVLPFEITKYASQSLSWFGRTIPTRGLMVYQMINALNNMGYSPELFSKPSEREYHDSEQYESEKKTWDPVGFIYDYIESRIPVLVSAPGHVVTIIGHMFTPNPICLKEKIERKKEKFEKDIKNSGSSKEKLIFSSKLFVNGFIIQDDSSGPYRILPIDETVNIEGMNGLLPLHGCAHKSVKNIEHIIVPLPEKIYLLGSEAYLIAEKFLSSEEILTYLYYSSMEKNNEFAKEIIVGMSPKNDIPNPVIMRCYFTGSSDYKTAISKIVPPSMHEYIRLEYMKMDMPHYIWVAEISTVRYFSQLKEENRRILGEILIDPTANKYAGASAWLSCHLPGLFIKQDWTEKIQTQPHANPVPVYFDKDVPYRHASRKSI